MNEPRFRLTAPGAIDVLGVWEAGVVPAAFAAPEPPCEESWRVDLPPTAPAAALDERAAALQAAISGVAAADRRLTAFVANPGVRGPVLYAVETGPVSGPEQELAAWVQSARGGVSFGYWDVLTGRWWMDEVREVRDFFAQLTRSLASAARVETTVGGVKVGVTVVGWRGGMATTWRAGADRATTESHGRAVALALATRRAWLGLAVTVVSGAAGLAARLAAPGGFVLAVPAAWRFVRRVMADFRRVGEAGG